MSNIKKLMMSGAAGGDALDVDDVFSTYLYDGTAAAQTITNDIDLAGEGGMVWGKMRSGQISGTGYPWIFDTERGPTKWLYPNDTMSEQSAAANGITSFNSDGFDLQGTSAYFNGGTSNYASWTFRKAPKFFDIVTYTGNGTSQTISHNLGSDIGFMVVKKTSADGHWIAWHKDFADTAQGRLLLNLTSNYNFATSYWNNTAPTSSDFTVGSNINTNQSGETYVAYLFAHNNGDGGFGPDGDQDIIKCGSYLNNNTAPVHIDLGWEPQWVLVRNITDASPWTLQDNMRGLVAYEDDNYTRKLEANSNAAETEIRAIQPTSTGFYVPNSIDGAYNSGNAAGTRTHIYMAIRRGSLFSPEAATEVFAAALGSGSNPCWTSGFPVDMAIDSNIGGGSTDNRSISSRLTQGRYLNTDQSGQESAWTNYAFDYMDGYRDTNNGASDMGWMWKRAPGYFDVVTYTGDSTSGHTVSHNLGVAPEMMWVKKRNSASNSNWKVYHVSKGNNYHLFLNLDSQGATGTGSWNATTPTDSVFTLGNQQDVNKSGDTYIAYLFATLAGISKVGSYTGNGSSQTINCGFSSGARFILIKRTSGAGDWYVWDTTRGINAGTEVALAFNSTLGYTNDTVDPASSGFIINQTAASDMNISGSTYLFYAIA